MGFGELNLKSCSYKIALHVDPLVRCILVFALLLVSACTDTHKKTEEFTPLKSKYGLSYKVKFEGLKNEEILNLIKEVSHLISRKDEKPATVASLKHRVEEDLPRFKKVLQSFGYYDALINPKVSGKHKSYTVIIIFNLGTQYTVEQYEVIPTHSSPKITDILAQFKKLKPDSPAISKTVLESEQSLVTDFANKGFPFAKVIERKFIADYTSKTLSITLKLDPGSYAIFGETQVTGLTGLDPTYVLQILQWKEGAPYDAEQIESMRQNLFGSGLFSSVKITHPTVVEKDSSLPIDIRLKEAKHRHFGAGVNYSTNLGPGFKSSWGNDNTFGHAEHLDLIGRMSKKITSLESNFKKPQFERPDQALIAKAKITKERPDAFSKNGFGIMTGLERTFTKRLKGSAGVSYENATVEDEAKKTRYSLVGFPLSVKYATTKNFLDPKDGWKTQLFVTPYPKSLGAEENFMTTFIKNAFYIPVDKSLVMSFWNNIGFTPGGSSLDVPPDKRFYVGGEGSVRGYGYQLVGPLDGAKHPLGGRSSFEGGTEARIKMTQNMDFVTFLEAGNVFHKNYPTFSKPFFWGTGVGIRYKTPVGPLRLDIGIPLNRRKGVDNLFQIYISIGQSF